MRLVQPGDGIFETVKKSLGIPIDDESFDIELVGAINSAIMNLEQLGVGQPGFYVVTGDESWADLLDGSGNFQAVSDYIKLKVKVTFDPPSTSFQLEALKDRINELEWRFTVHGKEG